MTSAINYIITALVLTALLSLPVISTPAGFIPGPSAPDKALEALPRQRAILAGPPAFEVSYLAVGPEQAPRLIFIHGTPGSALAWGDYLVDPLPGWRSLAYDRPGFGQTKPDQPVSSLALQAQVAELFALATGGRKPILIGHSLGGPIACRLAANRPGDIGALVILAGSLDPEQEKIAWYQHPARWSLFRALLPSALTNANDEVWPLKAELRDLEPLLSRISCPVIIVHGDEDDLVPPTNAPWLAKRLTGSAKVEMTIISGQNHFLPWNNLPAVRRAILRAIELSDKP